MFDQAAIVKNKIKFAENIKNSDFFQFIYNDLVDRLDPIDKIYGNILFLTDFPYELKRFSTIGLKTIPIIQLGSIDKESVDLVYFPYGFHWINNIQKFLLEVRSVLKNDGLFICNFPAGGSLANLRKILFLAEESFASSHYAHISPFIKFEDVGKILAQAGFLENIIDYETIMVEYDSPIKMMKAIKNLGESNAISGRNNYSITKKMYHFLANYTESMFEDQINLVSFVATKNKNSIKLKNTYE